MLDPVKLENGIFDLMVDMSSNEDEDLDPQVTMRKWAKGLAELIDAYTKGALVTTNGTATTQTGKLT